MTGSTNAKGKKYILQEKAATPATVAQHIVADTGYDALSKVSVSAIQTETKNVEPTTSSQSITPESGKFLTEVTVEAIQIENKSVQPTTSTQNITPTEGKYLTQVTVGGIAIEEKTVTENGYVTPTSGKYLSKVTVNVPTSGEAITLSTEAEMNAALTNATASDVGKVYKYTGTTTATYTSGSLYDIHST